jgi:hypothetical protein
MHLLNHSNLLFTKVIKLEKKTTFINDNFSNFFKIINLKNFNFLSNKDL